MRDPRNAFFQRRGMVDVAGNRNAGLFGEMAQHTPQHGHGRMAPAAGPRLQDHGETRVVRRLDEGNRILPAQHNKASDGIAPRLRGMKKLVQGGDGHLNFAIMSLMPGIVSI